MNMLIGLGSAVLLGIIVPAVGSSKAERLTRRAWTRLFILGATGLTILPGCGGGDPPPDRPTRRPPASPG